MTEWLTGKIPLRSCISLLVIVLIFCCAPASAFPQPLLANFTAVPQQGSALEPVQFTDTSTGDPVSWNWNFGDGTSSTLRNPGHTYSYLGAYTVLLNVTNAFGSTATVQKEISMADSGTPAPTTMMQEGLPPRPSGTPKSPAGIPLVLLSFLVVMMTCGKNRR